MATVKGKRRLSGSTDGRGIKVTATSTAGTLLHTAKGSTTPGEFDEIWLFAYNSDSTARLLTIEFGGVTVPDDNIAMTIPVVGAGLVTVVPGLILQNAVNIRAFAAAANVISIFGFVNEVVDD